MGNQTTKPEIQVEYTRISTEEPGLQMQDVKEVKDIDMVNFVANYIPGNRIPEVCWKYIPMLYTKQKPAYFTLAARNNHILEMFPESQLTVNICVETIKSVKSCFGYLRKNNIYSQVCLELLKEGIITLNQIDIEFQTFDMYHEVVKKGGFETIPKSVLTPDVAGAFELCLEAVKINGLNLKHIPTSLLDIKTVSGVGTLCLEAVKQNYKAVSFIPFNFWCGNSHDEGFEIAKIMAVKDPRIASELTPNHRFKMTPEQNSELWTLIITNNPTFVDKIPKETVNILGLYEIAIQSSKEPILRLIPEEYKSEELCRKAAEKDVRNIPAIPKPLFSTIITRDYILKNSYAIQYIDTDYPGYDELCLECVKKYYRTATVIRDVEKLKTLNEIKAILQEKIELRKYRFDDDDDFLFKKYKLKFRDLTNKSIPYMSEMASLTNLVDHHRDSFKSSNSQISQPEIPRFLDELLLEDTIYEGMRISDLARIFSCEKMASIFEENGNFKYLDSDLRLVLLKLMRLYNSLALN